MPDCTLSSDQSLGRIFQRYMMLFTICWCLFVPVFFLQAKTFAGEPQSMAAADLPQAPLYSILYEQLLSLEQEGKFVEALRKIPQVYAEEIPVESFYNTLEKKRHTLLETISQKEIPFSVGSEVYTTSDCLRLLRNTYLKKPETYHYKGSETGELVGERLIYFVIIAGRDKKSSVSRFDLQSALGKADPWIVSAAIFVSRKQQSNDIVPQDIVDRWQSRPDLWDEECTRQALLFLERFDAGTIKALEISNEDIRLQVKQLQHIANKKG